jgi:type IV secretion system protein TrbL
MLNFGDFLIAVMFRVIAALALIVTFVFYECVMLLSIIYVDIGLIVGPLLVPFLIWKPTIFLFDGWLKLMIQGGMYKIVASIILVYVGAMFEGFNKVDLTALKETEFASAPQVGIALGVMLVAGAGLYLMMQVQSIVGTIVGSGGIDMSPRLGRMASGAARGAGAIGIAAAPMVAAAGAAMAGVKNAAGFGKQAGGSRLGGGSGARMGSSSAKAVQMRSDRSNGAFGRGKAPRR